MGKIITMVTALLFVTLMFTGLTGFLGNLQSEFDFNSTNNYSSVYDAFNSSRLVRNTTEQTGAIQGNVSTAFNPEGSSFFSLPSFLDGAIRSIGTAITVFTSSGQVAGEMVTSSTQALNIPEWAEAVFITAILITIILIIAGLIMGRNF